jgi:hypothetical protein
VLKYFSQDPIGAQHPFRAAAFEGQLLVGVVAPSNRLNGRPTDPLP